jgi:hypothetical protein
MVLELVQLKNMQRGLRELVELTYSVRQNLRARVETPVLEDGTDIRTGTWLDSKTLILYGSVNRDKRHRFKIDHAFDLSKIVNSAVNSDGSVSIDEETYTKSQGTEFIIIDKADVKGAEVDYAIRADKYNNIREQLNKGGYNAEDLEKAGGFKIKVGLTPDEIPTHDGWRELAVGKNNASEEDYIEASQFLKEKYLPQVKKETSKFLKERHRSSDGTHMAFFVSPYEKRCEEGYKVRPWEVHFSDLGSNAYIKYDFATFGRFLKKSA